MKLEGEVCQINILSTIWFPNWDGTGYVFALKLNDCPWETNDISYSCLSQIAEEIIKKFKGRKIDYKLISNDSPFPEINNRYFNKKGLPKVQDLSKYYTKEGNREDFPAFVHITKIEDKAIEYFKKLLSQEGKQP
jgi:hypothetical protein